MAAHALIPALLTLGRPSVIATMFETVLGGMSADGVT